VGSTSRMCVRHGCRDGRPAVTPAPNCSPSRRPYRRERPWCPPSRRVPHKWSGRRPNRYMGRAAAFPVRNAPGLSEQRGGHQGLPRETPKCKERRRSRAPEPRQSTMDQKKTEARRPPFFDTQAGHPALAISYLVIFATTPAPTVRPPSRIAKRRPSSMAIGKPSVTLIFTLSPGITISTPSGSLIEPVTSVVRK
jgi:hypothetical protein